MGLILWLQQATLSVRRHRQDSWLAGSECVDVAGMFIVLTAWATYSPLNWVCVCVCKTKNYPCRLTPPAISLSNSVVCVCVHLQRKQQGKRHQYYQVTACAPSIAASENHQASAQAEGTSVFGCIFTPCFDWDLAEHTLFVFVHLFVSLDCFICFWLCFFH